MSRNRNKQKREKPSIDLMDLLSVEATADSRKLLKAMTNQDATDYSDLKQKLASAYHSTDDKKGMEQKMADIHPHKKWLLKYVKPEIKVEEIKKVEAVIPPPTEKDVKSNLCGTMCSSSNADGMQPTIQVPQKDHTPLLITGLVLVTIFAMYSKK